MPGSVRFGAFEFDPERRVLRKRGLRIRVPAQSLDILAALIERPGETVTRARIQSLLWPNGTVVGFEQSINAAVRRLREALGDPADAGRFIERVPRQGYRFVAPLVPLPSTGDGEPDQRPGAEVLQYRLIEEAGGGSMGRVGRALDTRLGRTVALKFLPPPLAEDVEALEAFRNEARHAAALNDTNVCTIHGLEQQNGRWFLVMEYIEGEPLSATLRGEPAPVERVLGVGIQAASALSAAHAAGIIHRDLKPANLMRTADGKIKLTDFGIARVARDGRPPRAHGGRQPPVGTLEYMSPQ